MATTKPTTTLKEAKPPFFVGVDLGGTNIKVGLVDDAGATLAWNSFPTDSEHGPEDATKRMAQAVRQIAEEAGLSADQVARIGLATPGTMDIPAGLILDPPNLGGWGDFPIRDRLRHHAGLPVTFVNDGTAAAYGEYWVGGAQAYNSLVLLTLGTGVGGGIIINNAPLHGEHSHGAECGHMIFNFHEDARICGCENSGHLEAYGSALSVIKRTQEALNRGQTTTLSQRLADGAKLTPKLVAEEAEKGDALSMEIVLQTAVYIGIGVVNLMHIIDPNCVLLGGAMNFGGRGTSLGDRFLDRVREEVRRRAFPVLAENTLVDFASLGGDAGYIGSAGLARLDHIREAA